MQLRFGLTPIVCLMRVLRMGKELPIIYIRGYARSEIAPAPPGSEARYSARYSWVSQNLEPVTSVELDATDVKDDGQMDVFIDLPPRAREILSENARLRFETSAWE